MASLKWVSKLMEDVTCPICMKILRDPVITDCGHNFCRQCIDQKTTATENPQCPICKLPVDKNVFRPNKQLASLAEKLLAIDSAEVQSEEEVPTCWEHKEKFHYFCEKDKQFLCLVCRDSKDHKTQEVTLIDEAAKNYKVQIETQLQILGQKDKEIIKEKKEGEGAIQVFRAQVLLERLKILKEFKHVRQRLEEEERFLLSRLSWLEQEGVKQIEESTEFEFSNPKPVPVKLEKTFNEAKERHESIIESLKKLTDNLITEGKKDKSTFLNSLDKKDMENLPTTLDMASADPNLTFSQDLKKASLYIIDGTLNRQAKPPQFKEFHCVRGSPGLSSGHGVWEVEIQGPSYQDGIVGVVTELSQGFQIPNSEPSCLWALRISSSGCQPITNCSVRENLPFSYRKVGIYVDYERGDIVFYDTITNKHIYTFQTSFDRPVFPYFGLTTAGSSITVSP
ncbi:hypothetical protein ACRRTK_022455 [Alexandromys fortis]